MSACNEGPGQANPAPTEEVDADTGADLGVDIPSSDAVETGPDRPDSPDSTASTSLVGTITYLDRPYDLDGWTVSRPLLPAVGALVELVRLSDGEVIEATRVGADGSYAFELPHDSDLAARLAINAQVSGDGFDIEVSTRSDGAAHAFVSARIIVPAGEQRVIDVALEDDDIAAAFNVADVGRQALEFLLERLPEPPADALELTVLWEHGVASPCGTCFNGLYIDLRDDAGDPDGFDDDIILHEIGHFVQAHLSTDDNPGGSHDGTRTDPTLAYGEGFAHFFSCWVRQEPTYLDYRASDWRQKNVETLEPDYIGTSDGRLGDDVSEFLVAGLLWDLADGVVDSDDDPVDAESALVATLFTRLERRRRRDLGVEGLDLADFIDWLRCELSPQEIEGLESVVTDMDYPFDFSTPLPCD